MNLDRAYSAARGAIESQYEDFCTIIAYEDATDPKTKRTMQSETVIALNQPCRLSYESIPAAKDTDTAAALGQSIKLFVAPEMEIKPGSRINVTRQGAATPYESSGKPAIYRTHQEIRLELLEEHT